MEKGDSDNVLKKLSLDDVLAVAKSAQRAEAIKSADIIKNKGVVIYLDVLGWRNLLERDEEALNKLSYLMQDLVTAKLGLVQAMEYKFEEKFAEFKYDKSHSMIEIIGAADTIAIFIKDYFSLAFIRAYMLISNIINAGAEQGIFFRGALSYGDYVLIKDSNFYMGQAVNEVAQWYEACDWVGVIMTPSAAKKYSTLNCILKATDPKYTCKSYIKYSDIPFKNTNDSFESYAVNCFYKNEDIFKYREALTQEKDRLEKSKSDVSIIKKYENTLNFYSYVKKNGLLL